MTSKSQNDQQQLLNFAAGATVLRGSRFIEDDWNAMGSLHPHRRWYQSTFFDALVQSSQEALPLYESCNIMSTAFLFSLFKMLADGTLFWTVVCPILATLTGLQGATTSPPTLWPILSHVILILPTFNQPAHAHSSETLTFNLNKLTPLNSVAHDASHGAASSHPRVNFFLSFVSIPWTYNTVPWFIQHVMQHHV